MTTPAELIAYLMATVQLQLDRIKLLEEKCDVLTNIARTLKETNQERIKLCDGQRRTIEGLEQFVMKLQSKITAGRS